LYIEYLYIISGKISTNAMWLLVSFGLIIDFLYKDIFIYYFIYVIFLYCNSLVLKYVCNNKKFLNKYPMFSEFVIGLLHSIHLFLLYKIVGIIFINLIKPMLDKLIIYILKMVGGDNSDKDRYDSDSDKIPGKDPKEPNDEFYIDVNGKRVKRRKRSEEQKAFRRKVEKENRKKKAEEEGRDYKPKVSLADLTVEERKERKYQNRRKSILKKREKDFKDFPFLEKITPRRKNKTMSEEECKEFDKVSAENRKKSRAAYWAANKHRDELKRPQRTRYLDKNNKWEDTEYWKSLVKDRKDLKFVKADTKGKGKAKEVLLEKALDKGKGKAKEYTLLDVVPNLKDKVKRTYSEIDSLSDSIYLPKLYESDEDCTFENDLRRAKEESKK